MFLLNPRIQKEGSPMLCEVLLIVLDPFVQQLVFQNLDSVPADITMTPVDINSLLKPLMLKDLRIQCRARNIQPAGSREALVERLKDHMLETNDL